MTEREPRWFTYLWIDEEGESLALTIGPIVEWMPQRKAMNLWGEEISTRLVWSQPSEPSQKTKDAITEGRLDGRRKYPS